MGLAPAEPARNPWASQAAPTLEALAGHPWTLDAWQTRADDQRFTATLDATLGHPGIPQSATGQTALLTGDDAVALMGGHYGPWPGPRLVARLQSDTLFHAAQTFGDAGAVLANAYSDGYLNAINATHGKHRRVRAGVAMVAAQAAGVRLRRENDRMQGEAVAVDLAVNVRSGERSGSSAALTREGETLARLANRHALTYLDVWLPDSVGHRADLALSRTVVERLDAFVDGVVGALASNVTLLITSDHGNFEDAGMRGHTRAPVPLLVYGAMAHALNAHPVRDLRDVRSLVQTLWSSAPRVLEADQQNGFVPSAQQQ